MPSNSLYKVHPVNKFKKKNKWKTLLIEKIDTIYGLNNSENDFYERINNEPNTKFIRLFQSTKTDNLFDRF